MATAILGTTGQMGGAALGGAIGGPIGAVIGGAIGSAVGSYAGSVIDNALFGKDQRITGVELRSGQDLSSAEGTPVPEVFGAVKVTGRPVWASQYRKRTTTSKVKQGGSGGPKTTVEENSYSRSWAISLATEVDAIGRVWANGQQVDLADWTVRLHTGRDPAPDPLIVAIEGWAPDWRGRARLVIEDLDLAPWGNRIPQLEVEVFRSLAPEGSLEALVRAVTIIPGSGEEVYNPVAMTDVRQPGSGGAVNRRGRRGVTDWQVSTDRLQQIAPGLLGAAINPTWYADDLRIGVATIRPKVDNYETLTTPQDWSVAGLTRGVAQRVPLNDDNRPLLGGTPSDRSVIAALLDLKARGLRASLHPFLIVGIRTGNGLPDPYGGAEQAAFPWRGRMTSTAAPADVADDVAAFFGSASASDFTVTPGSVVYTGAPADWGYRRFILHHAALAKAAGGIDMFLCGSEMVAANALQDAGGGFPFVSALRTLLEDVAAWGGVASKIGYSADWSELGGVDLGGGAFIHHLDPIWASAASDFVGRSNYLPLTDFRDGAIAHDPEAIRAGILGGELFDWFYASDGDRLSGVRTPITDGAYGEPWIFRRKDIVNWWSRQHFDRPGGVRSGAPTGWVPESKPIIDTELGFPALDRATNQPNVFFDPKSSESFLPRFSTGARDDALQRLALETVLAFWEDPANNPASGVYAGRMLDTSRTHLWSWDARPWPEYPAMDSVWSDGENHRSGHWLTGRLGHPTVAQIVEHVAARAGLEVDASRLIGVAHGVIREGVMTDAQFLAPLLELYQADAADEGGALVVGSRGRARRLAVSDAAIVVAARAEPPVEIVDAPDSAVAGVVRIQHFEDGADYAQALSATPGAPQDDAADVAAPVVMPREEALGRAQSMLAERRTARETRSLRLAPSMLGVGPGWVLDLPDGVSARVIEAGWEWALPVTCERWDADAYNVGGGVSGAQAARLSGPPLVAAPLLWVADLPRLDAVFAEHAPYLAAYARPWGGVDVLRGDPGALTFDVRIASPATMGALAAPLAAAAPWRWTDGEVAVRLFEGGFASATDRQVLDGANVIAVEGPGGWEVLQFATATLDGDGVWRLTRLLRGQLGTEHAMGAPDGARVIALDGALEQPRVAPASAGAEWTYRYGPAGRPPDGAGWSEITDASRGAGRRPLSPAHLRTAPDAGARVATWIRRERWAADSWDGEVAAVDPRRWAVRWRDGGGVLLREAVILDAEADTLPAAPSAGSVEVARIGDFWGEGPATVTEW